MGISITNAEVEAMARELASLRNVSVAEAIRQSLEQELARERQAEKSDDPDLYQRLLAISDAAGFRTGCDIACGARSRGLSAGDRKVAATDDRCSHRA
jgi:antitoxin VapB